MSLMVPRHVSLPLNVRHCSLRRSNIVAAQVGDVAVPQWFVNRLYYSTTTNVVEITSVEESDVMMLALYFLFLPINDSRGEMVSGPLQVLVIVRISLSVAQQVIVMGFADISYALL
jgi:hypothetical protein